MALSHTAALRKDSALARAYADTALRIIRPRRDPRLDIYEMVALAYLGRRAEAQSMLALVSGEAPDQPPPGWAYAQLQAIRACNLLGDRKRALQLFERMIALTGETLPLRSGWRSDPVTSPLRGDPKFEALFR